MAQRQSTTSEGTIIQINEKQIKDHLGEIVRGDSVKNLSLFPWQPHRSGYASKLSTAASSRRSIFMYWLIPHFVPAM